MPPNRVFCCVCKARNAAEALNGYVIGDYELQVSVRRR